MTESAYCFYKEKIMEEEKQIVQCIYKITNKITGRCYIGRSKYKAKYRFENHKNSLKNDPALYFTPLYTSMRFFGVENFVCEQIAVFSCGDLVEANKIEKSYIQKYNTFYPNGYNSKGLEDEALIFYREKCNNFINNRFIDEYLFFEKNEIITFLTKGS